jgi:hypothetical protein
MDLQKINQQTTLPDLWKDSNAVTVQRLAAGKFDEISSSVPNKIAAILECEPIAGLLRHVDADTVKAYLEAELIKLAGNVNINPALNLKDHQVSVIADTLLENYKWESIEDFTFCFRKGAAGLYGEIYRLDGAVIGQWMSKFLEEKYDALEQRKAKWKHNTQPDKRSFNPEHADNCIKQILKNLGVQPEEEKDNRKENEYQREKAKYTPPSREEVKKFILHNQWLRENYDIKTGKPLDTWMAEDEWLEAKSRRK